MITPIIPYWPWIMANPPAIPALYYGAISIEQRDLEMCKKIVGIESYLRYLSEATAKLGEELRVYVDEAVEEVEAQLEAEISTLRSDVQEQIIDLIAWVKEQTYSIRTWDVTRGLLTDSVDAMRRIFFDVTTDGATVDQLANSDTYDTVDALAQSGWNSRALAVIGATVLGIEDQAQWRV